MLEPRDAALLTDLYEVTMAASYRSQGMTSEATFDLFVRNLPGRRSFLVACGVERALELLEGFRFEPDAIGYLGSLGMFSDGFLHELSGLRFTGEVAAVPEGEVVFASEPILSVTAPLIEAQLVETLLLNTISFETMIASKAARIAIACGGKEFVDFSARRDHSAEAAVRAARAAYIGGAAATSNLLAGKLYSIPVSGTMAHSYVMAFDDESEAFRAFLSDFPGSTLLIDTFDPEAAVAKIERSGLMPGAVRIDSGDLAETARAVRSLLNDSGRREVRILASGDLDEYRIAELVGSGAPIDSFGVGTQLGTSADEPTLQSVYKMVAQDGTPKMKLSTGKVTLPGRKAVSRYYSSEVASHDLISLAGEPTAPGGRPLMHLMMTGGKRVAPSRSIEQIQQGCRASIQALPERLKHLSSTGAYEVRLSPALQDLVLATRERLTAEG